MSKILITGGAGYIGSHAVRLFLENNHELVVVDSLISSKLGSIKQLKEFGDFTFYHVDLRDREALKDVFEKEKDIDTILHFAALISVSESTKDPSLYFDNNVIGSYNLLCMARDYNIKNFIFSSTCAVYGESQYLPVDENHPLLPTNPYGETKLMMERLIKWFAPTYGINYVIFRYFNVCGNSKDGKLGYDKKPSEHLVPNAIKGALGIDKFKLTYAKVDTKDGSPIRDYLDVLDLADAHYKAYKYLSEGNQSEIVNLGTGKGFSVEEIVKKVEEIVDVKMPREKGETRAGEYAAIYANFDKAKKLLDWQPTKTLDESINNSVTWFRNKPQGF